MASTTTNVTDIDADVTFAVSSTASISEEAGATATFTVTLGGDALTGANTASVDIAATGTATTGADYDNFVAALVTAAGATAGVSFDGVDTLTFDAAFNGGSGTGAFNFTVDAIDDAIVEGSESIIATLSNEAVVNGSAALGVASTTTNVTDIDADVTFAVSSTASISPKKPVRRRPSPCTLGGDALTGANTASVDINATGTATTGTDYDNFMAALVTAAGATAGVSFDGVDTLTFDRGVQRRLRNGCIQLHRGCHRRRHRRGQRDHHRDVDQRGGGERLGGAGRGQHHDQYHRHRCRCDLRGEPPRRASVRKRARRRPSP